MLKLYVLFHLVLRVKGAVVLVAPGDNVTLRCSFAAGAKHMCWYKQAAGQQPRIVASFYKHSLQTSVFHEGFRDPRRFSVHIGDDFYHLSIAGVRPLDSAAFYCGHHPSMTATRFHHGILLVFKECAQPPAISQSPVDSVLGIMVVQENAGGGESEEKPQRRCIYTLANANGTLSDAGAYYCAAASCRGLVFEDKGSGPDLLPFAMNFLLAPLLVSAVINALLLCALLKKSRRRRPKPPGLQTRTSLSQHAPHAQAAGEAAGDLQYVALDFKKRQGKSKRRRRRSAEEEEEEEEEEVETVYSAVRYEQD